MCSVCLNQRKYILKLIFLFTLFTTPSKPFPQAPQSRSPPSDVNTSSFTGTITYLLPPSRHSQEGPILTQCPGSHFVCPSVWSWETKRSTTTTTRLGNGASYQVCWEGSHTFRWPPELPLRAAFKTPLCLPGNTGMWSNVTIPLGEREVVYFK